MSRFDHSKVGPSQIKSGRLLFLAVWEHFSTINIFFLHFLEL